MNILNSRDSPQSAFQSLHGYNLEYRDVVRCGIFTPVVCYRTQISLSQGQARGESGLSCGFVPTNPSAIYFYSFDTGQVKARTRFVAVTDIDLIAKYGVSKAFVPTMTYDKSYRLFLARRPAVAEPNVLRPGVIDESNRSSVDRLLPSSGTFLTNTPSTEVERAPEVENTHTVLNSVPDYPSSDGLMLTFDPILEDYEGDNAPLSSTDVVSTPAEPVLPTIDEATTHDMYDVVLEDSPVYAPDQEVLLLPDQERGEFHAEFHSEEESRVAHDVVNMEIEDRDFVSDVVSESEPDLEFPNPEPEPVRRSARGQVPSTLYSDETYTKAALGKRVNAKLLTVQALLSVKRHNTVVNRMDVHPYNRQVLNVGVRCNMGWSKGLLKWPELANKAIDKEIHQIIDYQVFHPTRDSPSDFCLSHDLIDEKMDGTIKARLVAGKYARGTIMEYEVSLFSPTVDSKLIFTLLSLGLRHDLELEVWDVKAAFFKAPMKCKELVYVRLNAHVTARMIEYRPEWASFVRRDGTMMVACDKAWYGTQAASSLWNAEVTKTLTEKCGYSQHSMVPCLFYKITNGVPSYILLHVDDLGVMFPADGVERSRVLDILEKEYETLKKQSGDSVTYIGLEILRDRIANQFRVGMKKRVDKVGFGLGFTELTRSVSNPAKNPATFCSPTEAQDLDVLQESDFTGFRSLVMTLNYITIVMPHIKFHVIWLATRQSKPTKTDWDKLMHLLRYVWCNRSDEIILGPMAENPTITVYTDASFDIYHDSKSHSCICIFITGCGAALYVSSNKQHCLARSSCDSEIIACEGGVFIGCYWRDVLDELGVTCTVIHMEDNQSCIKLIETGTSAYDRKERHVIRRVNFMYEYFQNLNNRSSVIFCPTLEMIADIGTKPLANEYFIIFKRYLMGICPHLLPQD